MKIITLLFLVGVITYYGISWFDSENDSEAKENPELSAPNDRVETDDKAFIVSDVPKNGLPSEKDFSDDLHHMTHEKVHAEQKWGRLEITEERIDKMLDIAKESDYKFKNLYTETLTEWQNGNFENAVKVHNTIWNERNGNVGKATRMMTDKEEEWYKESYYE